MSVSHATRLLEPDHWTTPAGPRWRPEKTRTYGPLVADICAKANFAPDPQQELALDLLFAFTSDGSPLTFEFDLLACRQNLKTGFFKQVALGWLFITVEPSVVWSSHEMSTTRASQTELFELIADAPALSRYLPTDRNRGLFEANGQERVELNTGQSVLFKARRATGGRGLAKRKLLLDEAFALKPAMLGSIIPIMLAQRHAQVVYGSSAPPADAVSLREIRDRGRLGLSPRLTHLEWLAQFEPCADPNCLHPKDALARGIDCALDREHLLLQANPTVSTGRITIQNLRDARQAMPPEEYMVECLGWSPEPTAALQEAVFGPGRWEACAGEPLERPEAPSVLGVAVSVDRTWASIASAALVEVLEDPTDDEAEPVDRVFVAATDRREDVGWLVAELKRIQDATDCVIVIDEKGPTEALLKDLEDADVAVETLKFAEYAEACSRFFDKVRGGLILHPSSAELDDAVAGATTRNVDGRLLWDRKKSATDVSMLEAATLAAYGAEKFGW